MKKFLLSLAAVALAGSAWATEESVTFDFVSNTYDMTRLSESTSEYNPDPTTVKDGNVQIVLAGQTRLWSDGLRFYKGSSFTVSNTSNYPITKIEILKSETTYVTSNFSKDSSSEGTLSEGVWANADGSDSVKINCTLSKGNQAVGKLIVYYETSGAISTLYPNDLSYTAESYTGYLDATSTENLPSLNNPNNLPIIYDSSDAEVATVDTDGNVEIKGIGTTTITAKFEGDDKYKAGTVSYTLNILDPNAVTFDFVNNTYGMTRYTSGSDYNTNPVNITEGIVSLTIDGGNNRLWSDGLRMYNKSKVTISVTTGYKITKVTYESTDNTKFTGTTEGLNYVISYTPTSSNKAIKTITVNFEEDIQSGVESVEFDSNAPKEYYNLQGVRVENPGKGLYIVRQGSKASKVIL